MKQKPAEGTGGAGLSDEEKPCPPGQVHRSQLKAQPPEGTGGSGEVTPVEPSPMEQAPDEGTGGAGDVSEPAPDTQLDDTTGAAEGGGG
jgi:hypothetical protein